MSLSKIIKQGKCRYLSIVDVETACGDEPDPDFRMYSFSDLVRFTDVPGEEANRSQGVPDETAAQENIPEKHATGGSHERPAFAGKDVQKESHKILRKAEAVLEEAKHKSAEIESEAYTQGFAQGRKDGEELGRRQYEATAQRLEKIIQSMQEQGRAILNRHETQLVLVAMEVARKVVQKEIATDKACIIHCIRSAMEQIIECSHIRIHVHPKDAEMLSELPGDGIPNNRNHSHEIVSDAKITPGGCLIETDFGLVDATMESKWKAVTEKIAQVLHQRTGQATLNIDVNISERTETDPD
ncbi:MAG TPA: hypothetical protein EYP57_04535 [Thermodesulfobacteriaceae bacterium]|nr:hypothetical protein [Thermodesulfobacteriaceae bacterium]